ncbi:gfo/Idh/MocA family oxidoreductase [Clavibacter michiganensis]|uniref:Gfo/Idh/MocA family oxidoreductase n=1 Tax=Clavibacter michiganensis TaxID=28447 RepID=A0A2S5VU58_9MICO|nr:Gfo/Idh/MocA family oxidoreductase [Clavibacter michiganensis]PPF52334.1 gfo/Idh/MocA family oxidoreductase [Clavibacter michiganensis]PPF68080.1 gfo/Idh/MocA family oxidoreductase [Clavibacter michiganensis]
MTPAPLRIGLVGAGGISASHLPHLLALGAEVYVHSEVGAAEAVARHGGGTVVDTLDELLDLVDVVDVVTPTWTHAAIVRRALEAGKDVISEKPLARTDADAQELVALAARLGRRLHPAHVVRFFPEYVRLKEAVDQGLLGDLAVLRFSRAGAFPTRTPWFADRALSGGIIMDQMIHDLDIARWVAGEVVRVSAVSTRAGDAEHPIEAAHVLLTHASGAISHVAGVWGPAHLRFTTEYTVTGTAGQLEHSSAVQRGYVADLADPGTGGELVPDTDPAEDPYYVELREFTRAFAGGAEPRVSAADGAAAVRIATAALESLDTGQPVDLVPASDGETAAASAGGAR